ncbi:MAG: tetratricopeptide repeat protein [Verrucomicrobia bacterium]|nr:tetratricopeptide repeat protein [Verrucomicrobiota bacterium]
MGGNLFDLDYLRALLTSPFFLVATVFWLWMLVDALRRREWVWAALIFFFSYLTALLYFFLVYRQAPAATRGFELPGAVDRRRIRELQAQIHHLDKPHHYLELGDIYFHQGKLAKAEAAYRAAHERDGGDPDIRAHLGQCLLRQGRPAEALPLLEGICRDAPQHDYGHSQMALAETLAALGDFDRAIPVWQQVTEHHSYPRARVQLAELHLAKGQPDQARALLREVLDDEPHAPGFQRRRDRVWVRRARRLLRQVH